MTITTTDAIRLLEAQNTVNKIFDNQFNKIAHELADNDIDELNHRNTLARLKVIKECKIAVNDAIEATVKVAISSNDADSEQKHLLKLWDERQ